MKFDIVLQLLLLWSKFGHASDCGYDPLFGEHQKVTACNGLVYKLKNQKPPPGRTNAEIMQAVGLKNIDVNVEVNGLIADVSTNFKYHNTLTENVEVVFRYPIPVDAAFYKMVATFKDGTVLKAVVKDRDLAYKEYEAAKAAGKLTVFGSTNMLGYQDIFTMMIGILPAGQTVDIELAYAQELPVIHWSKKAYPGLRFTYPAYLGIRYSAGGTMATEDEYSTNSYYGYWDLYSPRVDKDDLPYTFDFKIKVNGPASATPEAYGNNYNFEAVTWKEIRIQRGQKFWLNVHVWIQQTEMLPSYGILEPPLDPAEAGSILSKRWVAAMSYVSEPDDAWENFFDVQEWVIMLDRSGSMQGVKMDQAIETVIAFLDHIGTVVGYIESENDVPSCIFNIVSWGTRYKFMHEQSVMCSEKNLKEAKEDVSFFKADMGGTNLLSAMKAVTAKDWWRAGVTQRRNMWVITDGSTNNNNDSIRFASEHNMKDSSKDRDEQIISFGIGPGASSHLVSGIASEGMWAMVTKIEDVKKSVLNMLERAQIEKYRSLKLTGHFGSDQNVSVTKYSLDEVFRPADRFTAYMMLYVKDEAKLKRRVSQGKCLCHESTCGAECKPSFTLKGKKPGSTDEVAIATQELELLDLATRPFHRLAAKHIISDVYANKELPAKTGNDKNGFKATITKWSKANNVISPHTAFIAVDNSGKTVGTPTFVSQVPLAEVRNSQQKTRTLTLNLPNLLRDEDSSDSSDDAKKAKLRKKCRKLKTEAECLANKRCYVKSKSKTSRRRRTKTKVKCAAKTD